MRIGLVVCVGHNPLGLRALTIMKLKSIQFDVSEAHTRAQNDRGLREWRTCDRPWGLCTAGIALFHARTGSTFTLFIFSLYYW